MESWEQHNKLFVRPHRVLVSPYDPERHVWLVDDGAHAIYKFTRDGKQLVQTIGTPANVVGERNLRFSSKICTRGSHGRSRCGGMQVRVRLTMEARTRPTDIAFLGRRPG